MEEMEGGLFRRRDAFGLRLYEGENFRQLNTLNIRIQGISVVMALWQKKYEYQAFISSTKVSFP